MDILTSTENPEGMAHEACRYLFSLFPLSLSSLSQVSTVVGVVHVQSFLVVTGYGGPGVVSGRVPSETPSRRPRFTRRRRGGPPVPRLWASVKGPVVPEEGTVRDKRHHLEAHSQPNLTYTKS